MGIDTHTTSVHFRCIRLETGTRSTGSPDPDAPHMLPPRRPILEENRGDSSTILKTDATAGWPYSW